ncbi:MAG: molybdenum cofactor guanylyltransferase [Sphingomonadaceae bacterium]
MSDARSPLGLTPSPTPLLGALLAGGQARRFGADKALALLDGKRLIDRAIAALAAQCDAVVICGRDYGGMRSLADRPRAGLGPLGGLNAALHLARAEGFAGVLTSACDIPVLPSDLRHRLVPLPATVRGQPLVAIWPSALADALDAHLAQATDFSMRHWIAQSGAQRIAFVEPVPNINTPADLAALSR